MNGSRSYRPRGTRATVFRWAASFIPGTGRKLHPTRQTTSQFPGSLSFPTKVARHFHPTGCRAPLHDAFGESQSPVLELADWTARGPCPERPFLMPLLLKTVNFRPANGPGDRTVRRQGRPQRLPAPFWRATPPLRHTRDTDCTSSARPAPRPCT
jgi:hypothetical protein